MSKKSYYININRKRRNTAGMKAPEDIAVLCNHLGLTEFPMPLFPTDSPKIFQKIWLAFICSFYWIKLWMTVNKGDVVLFQHPMYGNRVSAYFIPKIQRHKGCKFIAVIHDLESLRKGIEGVIVHNQKRSEISDNILLKEFDVVICHNEHMKRYLISQGFDTNKLVCLGIFDYLCNYNERNAVKEENPSIAIAGNLAPGKCAYIYDILDQADYSNSNLTVHLYGNNFDESKTTGNIIYHGSYSPEELPAHLAGDFGLIWDGTSADTCAGNTGEYLKYNNPHKTSLYLASGMPVIVWSQAAIADFVLKYDVGIAVDSLKNLDELISSIPQDRYKAICENVNIMGKKIRTGYYFKEAFEEAMKKLGYNF